jgi:hypothetical protein
MDRCDQTKEMHLVIFFLGFSRKQGKHLSVLCPALPVHTPLISRSRRFKGLKILKKLKGNREIE